MPDQTYPVTIIADKCKGDTGVDSTTFVASAVARLTQIADAKQGPMPMRAATIIDVKLALERAAAAADHVPLSVQLVGHGLAGQLLLGMTWMTGADAPKRARSFPFAVVDTNPLALQFLRDFVGQIANVTLAGCHVGDLDVGGSGWAINGRSLTYCLSELLRCEVSAAIGFIGSDDFDDRGAFAGPRSSWTWKDTGPPTWGTNGKAEVDPPDTGAPLAIDGIKHTYLPVHNDSPHAAAATANVVPIAHRAELATATPEMTVTTPDKGEATIVGNARYLVTKDQHYRVTNRRALTSQLGAALRRV